MARKSLPAAQQQGPDIVTATPSDIAEVQAEMARSTAASALALSQQDAAVRLLAQELGYSLPADCTDPDLIQRDISANMRRSVEACLEVGRGLSVLRAACQHGQFMTRLDVLGLEPRVAQRFMASARKFSNAASTPLLAAAGNQTKLFELLVLDDDQVEELELTGQTGELKLDDIATMSVKELRAALREERAERAATDKLLAEKRGELDEAKRAKAKMELRTPSWDERVDSFKTEVCERQSLAEKLIGGHLESVHALDAWLNQELCNQLGYDPQSAELPPAIQGVLLTVSDSIERLASLVGALQHELDTRFGADIEDARRHLMVEPGAELEAA